MDHIADRLLTYLIQTKFLHWQTKSYARHKAFDSFFDDLSDSMDLFIEVHMGKRGRVKTSGNIEAKNMNELQVQDFIDDMEEFLISLTQEYDRERDSDILNIRDEMLGHVNQLKYLLTLD